MSGIYFRILVFIIFFQCIVLRTPLFSAQCPVNERILVIQQAAKDRSSDKEKVARGSLYDGLVEQLSDLGYRIVDKSSAEQTSLQIAATHDIDPLLNKAASFGLKFFAEYSIYFKTSTVVKDRDDSKGALVKVSAKIIDNTSCQVVVSKSAEASSAGLTVEDAVEKAARSAGKKLGGTLSAAMIKNLTPPTFKGKLYTLVFETDDSSVDLLLLLTKMEALANVSAARESESGGGKSTFELLYKGKRDQLEREVLGLSSQLGWKMIKVRSEGNRSTWKIK